MPPKEMPMQGTLHHAIWEFRRDLIVQRLQESGMNLSACARSLNIHRNTLIRLIEVSKLDIRQMRRQWRIAGVWIK
jgi:ActR/RegA family two-component response regulator